MRSAAAVGKPGIGQDAINTRMIEAAQSGQRVVRLKGGDPFVFGRGGEEVEALRSAGVAYSIIPGITAGLGGAADFEVPLTYRHEATRITFLTAHRARDAEAVDWSTLTDTKMTVVVYMGMTRGNRPCAQACSPPAARPKRRSACSPASRGPDAQGAIGTLRDLPELVRRTHGGPAMLIIGDVVRHAGSLRRQTTQANHLRPIGCCRMTSPLQQKLKITGPSVVTANRTWDGVVVYRTAARGWSVELTDAAIVRNSDEAKALLAEAVADDVGAIGPYIAPVQVDEAGKILPGNLREQIRRDGVTIGLPV
ncbi:hypothetical protein BRDID11002_31500 [Bradyrhizobium diazoefficiens]